MTANCGMGVRRRRHAAHGDGVADEHEHARRRPQVAGGEAQGRQRLGMALRQDQHHAEEAGGDADEQQRARALASGGDLPGRHEGGGAAVDEADVGGLASCARRRRPQSRRSPWRGRPAAASRSRCEGGARQRSRPGRIRAIAAITRPDSDQRTSDRVAGPKSSTSARPVTGLRAKQAGTRASSRSFIGQARPGARFAPSAGENGGFGEPCRRILCTAPPAKGGAHVVAGLRKRHLDRRASPERRGAAARGCTRKRDCNGQRQRQERERAERDTDVGGAARHAHGGARSSSCGPPGRWRCRGVRPPHEGAGAAHRQRARSAGVRDGCHHEPAADLGHGAGAAGRHVPGREGRRRARCATRILPRRRRVPILALGVGPRRARGADDARHVRRGLHADPQGALARARGVGEEGDQRAGVRRRLHGGGHRRSLRARGRAGALGRAGVPVPGRAATRAPRRRSARSRVSPRAPTAGSTRARRRSCASCSRRSPCTRQAGARRSRRLPATEPALCCNSSSRRRSCNSCCWVFWR